VQAFLPFIMAFYIATLVFANWGFVVYSLIRRKVIATPVVAS